MVPDTRGTDVTEHVPPPDSHGGSRGVYPDVVGVVTGLAVTL